jgi:hypothetical protein
MSYHPKSNERTCRFRNSDYNFHSHIKCGNIPDKGWSFLKFLYNNHFCILHRRFYYQCLFFQPLENLLLQEVRFSFIFRNSNVGDFVGSCATNQGGGNLQIIA